METNIEAQPISQAQLNLRDRVRFVLVQTSLARNIGSAARAMKNMGVRQLVLVAPEQFPHPDAEALAAGADDILQSAVIVPDLASAIADCVAVYGTSVRRRNLDLPTLSPRQMAESACQKMAVGQVAVVFGSERVGLENDQLAMCQARVEIPTAPDFASLNLAQAVQLLSYELRLASLSDYTTASTNSEHLPAEAADLERFITHLDQYLGQIEFYGTRNPQRLLLRLRQLYQRAQPSASELQMLRGILTESSKRLRKI